MANQQLVDYVKQQLQLGVNKDAIKGTLAQAGWPEADVNEALTAASPSPAAAVTPAVPSSPTSSVLSKFAQKPTTAPASQSSPFVTKDIFQPKGEATFQPKIQTMPTQTAAQPTGGSSVKKYILLAVWIVVVLGLAAWSAYLFWQNRTLKNQVSQSAGLSASLEEARAQIASLTNDKSALTSQLDAANLERNDLLLHLSFFAAPIGEVTTTDITVSGTLGGGGKSPYTLTTGRQVVLSVKNSSDSDVSEALQPLLGNVIGVTGTYIPGTRNITVVAVNGVPVEEPAPAPASTSTPISTPPAAP